MLRSRNTTPGAKRMVVVAENGMRATCFQSVKRLLSLMTSALLRQIAAIRRTKAGDQSQNVFERLETAGQSYFSIKKTKSPAPTLKEPEKDLRGNALDLSLDQDSAAIATEDGSKRPPISKRFDLSKIDTTLFDELLPIEIRPSRKYVPVPLDQKVILRRETREPRNSVSLEEFLKKPL
mmetsp:Transcript_4121/g.17220  ORF Transcript_4121/g.17220 Transcript_4121/m.17220 type:complete len:179 (-) Transcript_4121:1118-1654(-)